ncbi:GTPase Era, mitochondrial [Belonocnema kinseyi]|uniref:GTPase Era, mitochondrial n=1 Tax=Belonocnema kinseyi TaxID=2817044 RepID=UPI00143CCB25|nr:GTPase Era, mitochondrial [Belonocnema kinseyi]
MLLLIERKVFQSFSRILRRFSTNLETNFNANGTSDKNEDPEISNSHLKSLKIAIIGLPNAGKSTLINQLVNRTICATSSKVHTTRKNSEAVYVEGDTQLVFIDTPGLVSSGDFKRYNMEDSFRSDVNRSLKRADIVGVVQDMENSRARERISKRTLPLLEAYGKNRPTILILNKVDRIKKKKHLLDVVKNLTDEKSWPHFIDIFMVSALKNDGVDDLRNYFLDSSKWKKWDYDAEIYTDQSPELVVERTVKATLLDDLPQELPYKLVVKLEHLTVLEEGTISSLVQILCPTERICKVVLGPGGQRIKDISLQCEKALSNGFRTTVRLTLAVSSAEKKN